MARGLLVLLSLCALVAVATAAVAGSLRLRRDLDDFETTTEIVGNDTICAPKTPCAWSVATDVQQEETKLYNTFCICAPEHDCLVSEYDSAATAHVFRCRKLEEQDEQFN